MNDNIYIDIGAVDTSKITPENKPNDFWGRLHWQRNYGNKHETELKIYGENKYLVVNRILADFDVDLLLELPEHKNYEDVQDLPSYNAGRTHFLIHPKSEQDFQAMAERMPELRLIHHRDSNMQFPVYHCKHFEKGEKDISLLDHCDHITFHHNAFTCFGNNEGYSVERFMDLLQPRSNKENPYLLETIHVNAYIESCSPADAPDHLKAVDIKDYTASSLTDILCRSASAMGFDGFRCEFIVVGTERNSLYLLIEDKKPRWDGGIYQILFRISLYLLPGVYSKAADDRDLIYGKNGDASGSFLLDSVFVAGDLCHSFAELKDWADGYFFGYRVD